MSQSIGMSGASFRGTRRMLGLNQHELAAKLGVARRTVVRYEALEIVPEIAALAITALREPANA